MLKTKIKANAISNLTDARYFAAWEVEWLGFNLAEGNQSLSLEKVAAIKEWVDGVKIIGEFNLTAPETIKKSVDYLNLHYIQIGMFSDPTIIKTITPKVKLIQELVMDTPEQFDLIEQRIKHNQSSVEHFILDLKKNRLLWPNLSASTKERIKRLTEQFDVLIHLDLTADQALEILNTVNPLGFCVEGGEEEKVGYKSFEELDELFESLEILV